jgi:hypothetical protein
VFAIALAGCGSAPPPPAMSAPPRCSAPGTLGRPITAQAATPTSSGGALGQLAVGLIGLAIQEATTPHPCPSTTSGASAAPTPADAPLAFAAIDEGAFACESASGLDDVIVSETIGDAVHTCEELTGEPCACAAR